jgi:glycosyltransferase involved in cell wall biosynthesis
MTGAAMPMQSQRRRIATISAYAGHPSGRSIEQMVAAAFPEYEVDHFSVLELLKEHRGWIGPNLVFVAVQYGPAILRRYLSVRDAYFFTTFAFRKLRETMRRTLDPGRYAFSFQLQSLYDTSVPGIPHFVYTDHTHLSNLQYPDFDRRRLRPAAWRALERTVYRNATAIFTRSSNVSSDLLQLYDVPPEKVECVYAGSNLPGEQRSANNVSDIDAARRISPAPPGRGSQRRILFVGMDWERKGGPDLLQAFRLLRQDYPDVHLTIVGPEMTLSEPNCEIAGRISPAQLEQYYADADIFCLPTRREPFGIAFVEAMTHRLPIVGTRVGAVPDMVEDGFNGYLTEPGDIAGLHGALRKMLADPVMTARMGERGFERAAERYNWTNVGKRIRARVMKHIEAPPDATASTRTPTESRTSNALRPHG